MSNLSFNWQSPLINAGDSATSWANHRVADLVHNIRRISTILWQIRAGMLSFTGRFFGIVVNAILLIVFVPVLCVMYSVTWLLIGFLYFATGWLPLRDIHDKDSYVFYKQQQDSLWSAILTVDNAIQSAKTSKFLMRFSKHQFVIIKGIMEKRLNKINIQLDKLNKPVKIANFIAKTEDELWKSRSKAWTYQV